MTKQGHFDPPKTSELARYVARVALGPVTLLLVLATGGAPHETDEAEGWMMLDGLLGTLLWPIVLAVVPVSLWTVLQLLFISIVGMIVLAIAIGLRP